VGAWLFDASPKFRADAADSTNVLRILTGYSTRFTPLEFRALVRRAEAVLHMANPWPQPKADVTDAVLKLMAAFTVANGKTYGVPKRTPRSPDIGFHVDIDSPHGDEWLFTAEFAPRAKRGKPVLMSEKLEVTLFDWSAGQTPLTFRVRGQWARRAVVHVTVGVDWTLSNALYEARFEKIGPHEGWASYESFAKVASYHSPAYAHHLGRKLIVRLDFWGDCDLPKLNLDG
jgi:hypothetical protein